MRCFRFLVLATLATAGVFLTSASASAHDLRAKVTVADTVKVEAYFSDDTPAETAEVTVMDDAGAVVLTGKTDERGVWTFPRPKSGTYSLTVKSVGHVAKVPFRVDGDSETAVVYTGWRMNKALGLTLGLVLLLGISAASWFIRRRGARVEYTSPIRTGAGPVLPTDDLASQLTAPAPDANSPDVPTPRTDSTPPTFPSEAELLLKHLRLGAPRPEAAGTVAEFPVIPNYEIESELGSGGMGVVYKARHTALHHTVAIKMILASAHAAPGEVIRFLAEAEAVAAVKHPNVVQVYDLGNSDSRPYFVMEFVAGGNLASRLKNGGALSPTAAAELIEAVARGVQAAHEAGIVHRDLKPANILLANGRCEPAGESKEVSPAGSHRPFALTPKVSDFGLAKRLSSDLTRSQAVLGTPAYMAPEQAGGKAKFVGPQADVYALGVILYECLSGTVPFKGDDAWSLIRQVLEDQPESLRKLTPGVPRDLELICLKCLEKEPHHRYPTAAALGDDLLRFLRGEPVSVRPIGATTRALRWAKKRPAAATLTALGILALLILPPLVVGIAGWLDRRAAVADEAKQKEAEAEKARIAAERLAEVRELFALQNKFRNRAAERSLGWTAATRDELPRALTLADGDPQVIQDLRSVAAKSLLAQDLFPLEPVARGLNVSAAATDPKTGLVAVGEFKSWGYACILLVDLATGQTVRQLTYPTIPVVNSGPLDLVQDGTRSLAFSPNGKFLFAGTRSSRVLRFDLEKPQNTPAAIWKVTKHAVEQLAVSPNGKIVYGLCRPRPEVFAWDAETGKPQQSFVPDEKGTAFCTFAILPSGDLLASNGIRLYRWKADSKGQAILPSPGCFRLAAAGGSMLLMSDGFHLNMHDLASGGMTNPFTDPNLRRTTHEGYIRTIVVHPSGAFIATEAGDNDRTVKVWELASGRLIGTVTAPGTGPIAVAWSGDGNYLVASAEKHVERWRFARAESQRFACFAGPPLDSATFAADGKVAALGAYWNGKRELLLGKPGMPAAAVSVEDRGSTTDPGIAARPEGVLAVTLNRPGILLWKPGTPLPEPKFTREVAWCPQFAPDGRTLWAVVDSKTVRTYDPVTTTERAKWSNSIAEVVSGLSGLNALAVGHIGAVAGGRDGSVYLLDPTTCEPTAVFRNFGDPVLSVAFAPNDQFAVAGTQNGKLRVIRLADRTELPMVQAHPGGVTAVAINRDSTLLATGGRDRTVRLWKRAGDHFELLFAVGKLSAPVTDLQFNLADDQLLVLLASEHAVRVWDIAQLKTQLVGLKLGW